MNAIWQELRLAARSLARAKGFTVAVVATLAIAIALQASIGAIVNAYVVRSLPYPAAERLYNVIYAERPQNPPDGLSTLDWASLTDVVEHPIAWDLDVFYMLGGEYPERAPGAWVTEGFSQGLGIRPGFGRAFTTRDFAPGEPQVALISHELWRSRFDGDSSVVGRRFSGYVSDRPAEPETFTIVGVLSPSFWHLNPYTQVLTPLRAQTYPYVVRLRAGVAEEMAEHRIERLVRDAGLSTPPGWRVDLRPTHAEYVSAAKPMLKAVGGAVTIVSVIACANVALLMVLRGLRRRKEVAVRVALGAGPLRVLRLLLAETLLLAGSGAAAGVALAALALRALAPTIEVQLGRRVPGGVAALGMDWSVVLLVGAAVLALAVLLSLTPLAGVGSAFGALRERRSGRDAGGRRVRTTLIAVEVAGSLALLAGSGLMVRSVVRLLDVDLGVQTDGVVSAGLAIREQSYPDEASRRALYPRLVAALRAEPRFAGVALSVPSPLESYAPRPMRAADASADEPDVQAAVRAVAGDFFGLMGIAVARGRAFTDADGSDGAPVAIVSEAAARLLWPRGDALGRPVRVAAQLSPQDSVPVVRTVVGVVRDVRQSPTDEQLAEVYVPLGQTASRFASAVVRTSGAAPSWAAVLRTAVRSVDAEIAVGTPQHLDVVAGQQLTRPRFLAWLFTVFGVFAAILGVMGLYAVIAYTVKQREHEIAVRIAIGAQAREIVAMFLREGSGVVVAGVVLGLFAAVGVGRLIRAQLYGVTPLDAVTLATVSVVLMLASAAAIWWPSLRASRTDPASVLKAE